MYLGDNLLHSLEFLLTAHALWQSHVRRKRHVLPDGQLLVIGYSQLKHVADLVRVPVLNVGHLYAINKHVTLQKRHDW